MYWKVHLPKKERKKVREEGMKERKEENGYFRNKRKKEKERKKQ